MRPWWTKQSFVTNARRSSPSPDPVVDVAADVDPEFPPAPTACAGLTAEGRANRLVDKVSGGSAARRRSPVASPVAEREWALRVLVVEDDPRYSKLLLRLLDEESWIEVVGSADNGRDAVTLAADTKPDVILMDFEMPLIDGLVATTMIKAQQQTIVLVLTSSDNPGDRERLLDAGAHEVLSKMIDPEQLLARLHGVHIDRSLAALGFERVEARRN